MDRIIKRLDRRRDGDVVFCESRGIAYQRDMSVGRVPYDASYLANYDAYANGPIADALNAGRVAMLQRHAFPEQTVLDVGAAAGQFVQRAISWGFAAKGYDVIPEAVSRLKAADRYEEDPSEFDVVTFWDSLEHMEEPELWLGRVKRGALVLVALPIHENIVRVRYSKHFKPGEHYYHFTAEGFVAYMRMYGFRLLEESDHETKAGREAIGAFAFRKDLPTYRDFIDAYSQLHAEKFYGASATELHLSTVAGVVRALKPQSILDFGCGRSDLVAHFWKDGERRIERYDPAIPSLKRLPDGEFDLVIACDVMEHIPIAAVDKVLQEIRSKSAVAFFTISTKLARARLPDGSNAHCTLLSHSEWTRWIRDYFGPADRIEGATSEHELVLLAGAELLELKRAA